MHPTLVAARVRAFRLHERMFLSLFGTPAAEVFDFLESKKLLFSLAAKQRGLEIVFN